MVPKSKIKISITQESNTKNYKNYKKHVQFELNTKRVLVLSTYEKDIINLEGDNM